MTPPLGGKAAQDKLDLGECSLEVKVRGGSADSSVGPGDSLEGKALEPTRKVVQHLWSWRCGGNSMPRRGTARQGGAVCLAKGGVMSSWAELVTVLWHAVVERIV